MKTHGTVESIPFFTDIVSHGGVKNKSFFADIQIFVPMYRNVKYIPKAVFRDVFVMQYQLNLFLRMTAVVTNADARRHEMKIAMPNSPVEGLVTVSRSITSSM